MSNINPTVIYPQTHHWANRRQPVRGGSWLVRHAHEIERIEVVRNEFKTDDRNYDAIISAYCYDGKYYTSEYNSIYLLWQWLQRRSLIGIRLMWLGEGMEITRGAEMPELP